MGASGGMEYQSGKNRLWVDLHKCTVSYAVTVFEEKLAEAYRYGLVEVEFIYGTPDNPFSSIERSITELCESDPPLLDAWRRIHAGIIVNLKTNPSPEAQDQDMCFAPILPEYDGGRFKEHDYRLPYFPLRAIYDSGEVAAEAGCSKELSLNIARSGFRGEKLPDAKRRTVWDSDWNKNITTWHFTRRDIETLQRYVAVLRDEYLTALADRGVTEREIDALMQRLRTVVEPSKLIRHGRTQLTKLRNQEA